MRKETCDVIVTPLADIFFQQYANSSEQRKINNGAFEVELLQMHMSVGFRVVQRSQNNCWIAVTGVRCTVFLDELRKQKLMSMVELNFCCYTLPSLNKAS